MERHPILTFRHSSITAIPVGSPRNIPGPVIPERTAQIKRVGPQLQNLQDSLRRRSLELQNNLQGIDPEFALVFEVVGKVDSFLVAAKRAGMEWLGDFDCQVDADADFYNLKADGNRDEKPVTEKFYLTMVNQEAIDQMLSLWKLYQRGKDFPTGLTAFRDVFSHLRKIRKWDAEDRLEDNVVNEWRSLLQSRPEFINFEIELWYRDSVQKREEAESVVSCILAQYGGKIVRSCVYPEIGYHGLVVKCPAQEVQRMIDTRDNDLINAEQIMWLQASGQAIVINPDFESEERINEEDSPLPQNPPVVALLDGMPLQNHSLLAERLVIADPDNYETEYTAERRIHGTAMASLIIHGDLNHPYPPLNSKLYVRPILKPFGENDESVPTDELFVDILQRSIKEIAENPENNSIRIVNLSIGNRNKPFAYTLSPEAKMLDYLSWKYNLLILVSTGNAASQINLPMKYSQYRQLSDEEKMKAVYKDLWDSQTNMRILSPSESVNSVAIGALHSDNAVTPSISGRTNPVKDGYPTLYSCFGGGYGRSIKPDCVLSGGKIIYSIIDIDSMDATLRPIMNSVSQGPGHKVASVQSGINSSAYLSGSSNSTALASRLCAEYLNVLKGIPHLNIPEAFESIALKAMLIHSCLWGTIGQDLMDQYVPKVARKTREETLRWIGYGEPSFEISSFCTDQRVTLIGYGALSQNRQTEFSFKMPSSLIAKVVKKRLTITLAWKSPIAPLNKNYRLAKLWFEANKNVLVNKTTESDDNSSKRGTVQHEVFEGTRASTYMEGDRLAIKVACKKEEALVDSVPFVLMATLEVAPKTGLQIYNEVAASINVDLSIAAKV